jgi:hypothetical protein
VATLTWDKPGERIYETGVDRGVFYPKDGPGVAWNGFTGIEESPNPELQSFYNEGINYLNNLDPGEFLGKLKAFTYPDELEPVLGIVELSPGFVFHDQPSKSFGLTYRTRVGSDIEGTDHGYKIHLLYNLLANPDSISYASLTDSNVSPVEFAWNLIGTPTRIIGYRPTVHVTIDSRKTPIEILSVLEGILYGTDTANPSLPPMSEVAELFGYHGALIIVDHGDGSWTAIDESDTYINMISPTEFSIHDADTTTVDPDTYTISSTNVNAGP